MKRLAKIPMRALKEADFGAVELRILGFYGQVDRESDAPEWHDFNVPALSALLRVEPEVVYAAHARLVDRGYLETLDHTAAHRPRLRHRLVGGAS